MKKISHQKKDELRPEYKIEDFPKGFIRGKYIRSIKESSNIIVLKPEVVDVFPNEESVNSALLSLIQLANKTVRIRKRSTQKIHTKKSKKV